MRRFLVYGLAFSRFIIGYVPILSWLLEDLHFFQQVYRLRVVFALDVLFVLEVLQGLGLALVSEELKSVAVEGVFVLFSCHVVDDGLLGDVRALVFYRVALKLVRSLRSGWGWIMMCKGTALTRRSR